MTEKTTNNNSSKIAVVMTIGLLVVFAFIFLIMFIISSTSNNAPQSVSENTYRAEVDAALANADPLVGEQLIEEQPCAVCHVLGNGTVAPLFTGIANRAGDRHPPLSAEQYLYESIVHPGALVVQGYTNSMPNNYGDILTQEQIGHIMAYLLTLTEEPEATAEPEITAEPEVTAEPEN